MKKPITPLTMSSMSIIIGFFDEGLSSLFIEVVSADVVSMVDSTVIALRYRRWCGQWGCRLDQLDCPTLL